MHAKQSRIVFQFSRNKKSDISIEVLTRMYYLCHKMSQNAEKKWEA